jgi:hypothetical protein
MCGNVFSGDVNVMYENIAIYPVHHYLADKNSNGCHMPNLKNAKLPKDWKETVSILLKLQGYNQDMPFYYKDSVISQLWPIWVTAFPTAKWIIVRRKTPDIINSCIHTAYMKRFKSELNLKRIGTKNEYDGWRWWVHQYEERFLEIIDKVGENAQQIWPERMADGDYEQMKEIVKWTGLQWNDKIEEVITPLFKNRK